MLTPSSIARGTLARLGYSDDAPDRHALARSSLLEFTRATYPNYIADPIHQVIAAELDKIVSGENKRLIICAPPQHGKTELASVRLPAYWLGKRPNDPVILTSYAADHAHNKSYEAREIVESDLYGELFPFARTRSDSRAKNRWRLSAPYRGSLLASGSGGPITGSGAMLGIIDDPFANWAEAQSPTIRQNVWTWYRSTFRTRIWEGGAIVIIMTRWHEDDLIGRILSEQADKWTVLRIPAIAETPDERDDNNKRMGLPLGLPDPLGRAPGEPAAPSRFSAEGLAEIRADVGAMAWAAEYQGSPRAAEGNRFKRAWFDARVDAAPRGGKFVRYWDKAGTEGGSGAATAGVLMTEDAAGLVYVVDVVRVREGALQREATIRATAESDRQHYGRVKIYVEQEPGSGGKESAEATIRNLRGFTVYKDPPVGNKDARLQPFESWAEAGNVRLVRGSWNADFVEELTAIPNGRTRDQADAAAGAFNKLVEKPRTSRRVAMTGYGRR